MERKLKIGETVQITLQGAAGGYHWAADYQSHELKVISTTAVGPTIGGPAQTIFTVTALKKGNYVIDFTLKRQWDRNPLRQEQLLVRVETD